MKVFPVSPFWSGWEIFWGEGYVVENIDATIIAQRPKLASYRPQMAENIARALKIDVSRVSVKATPRKDWDLPEQGKAWRPRQLPC